MVNNKLVQMLETLSRKEMTRFYEFCCSPYYNKHKDVIQLVGILNRYYPKFTDSNCDRKLLFRKLFPKAKKHDQGKLALIFTYSLRLLEQFLIREEIKKDEFFQNLLLLKNLRERRLNDLYEKKLQKQETKQDDLPWRDNQVYHQRYLLAGEADNYYMTLSQHKKDNSIQEKQDNLDRFFLAEKLKDACEMRVRGKILQLEYQPAMLQAVLKEVEGNWENYRSAPAIIIYYWIFNLVNGGEVSSFFAVRKELQRHHQAFPKEELQALYNYLQHYCIEQINKGNQAFLNELFKLYKTQLEQELLLDEGQLSEWHYKNIVTTGLRLGETSWVNQFIESYKKRLPEESLENAYTFNKASYYYEVQEYEKVLGLLIRVEYTDIRYSLGAKALLLRTYYDKAEFEAFTSLAESFRQYLFRNKLISDSRRQGFSNLIKFAKRAFQLKIDKGYLRKDRFEKDLHRLQKDIANAAVLFNQSWLEQKIDELEG
jgi:hypothetical protein